MTRLVRAELRALRTTPTTWWLLLGVATIGVIGTVAPLLASDATRSELLGDHQIQEALHGAAAGATLVLVVGIIAMAGDWRWGQVTQTFITTPVRRRVVAAKLVVHVGVGAVFGIVAAAVSLLSAWGWYRHEGVALPLDRSAVWLTLLGCVLVSTLFGPIGVAVGAVVRNVVAGVIGALVWQVLVEPALFTASPSLFRWLPGIASFAIRRQPAEDLLGVGPAAVVLAVVLAGSIVAGILTVERRDVTT